MKFITIYLTSLAEEDLNSSQLGLEWFTYKQAPYVMAVNSRKVFHKWFVLRIKLINPVLVIELRLNRMPYTSLVEYVNYIKKNKVSKKSPYLDV